MSTRRRGLQKQCEYGCQLIGHKFTSKLKLHLIVDAMVFVDLVVISSLFSERNI